MNGDWHSERLPELVRALAGRPQHEAGGTVPPRSGVRQFRDYFVKVETLLAVSAWFERGAEIVRVLPMAS
ncbi:MAG: hypothetical protein ACREFP_18610 [Acetobacteraceae bacterium]